MELVILWGGVVEFCWSDGKYEIITCAPLARRTWIRVILPGRKTTLLVCETRTIEIPGYHDAEP
jgi:hypothetical protein